MAPRSLDRMDQITRAELAEKRANLDQLTKIVSNQFVRRRAWLPVVEDRANRCGGTVNYFTLTTSDLLDVKILVQAGILEQTEKGFPGVGFCERTDIEHTRIIQGLRSCRLGYKGTFEQMVNNEPDLISEFDYDVVNLDFILAPFPGVEAPIESTLMAIKQIIQAQIKNEKGFDLFVSFKGNRNDTDIEALQMISKFLRENLEHQRGVVEFEERVGHLDPDLLLEDDYLTFLCMGIPKLLISYALELGYVAEPIQIFQFGPEIDHLNDQILKFVLRFDLPDLSLSSFAAQPGTISSYEESVPLIFTAEVNNVDATLAKTPGLKDELQKDIENLAALSIAP